MKRNVKNRLPVGLRLLVVLTLGLIMAAAPPPAEAQFLKKLSKGLEKINQGLESVEKMTKEKKKKADKAKSSDSKKQSSEKKSAQQSASSGNTAADQRNTIAESQKKGEWKPGDTFTPGICNRLDRNTSGLVMAGKNLAAVQKLSDLLKTRGLDKYYLTIVEGVMEDRQKLRGFLQKNEKKNQVAIYREAGTGRVPVETHYEPLCNNGIYTLLKVKLVTGKTHQIRAHLAGTGHPVLGDLKYGAKPYKGQRQQLLHAWKMIFPEIVNYPELSGRCFTAALPENFQRMIKELFDNYKIMEV